MFVQFQWSSGAPLATVMEALGQFLQMLVTPRRRNPEDDSTDNLDC